MAKSKSAVDHLMDFDTHYAERAFGKALVVINSALALYPEHARLHIRKADLLQLMDADEDEDSDPLAEVDRLYRRALELEPDSVEALISLGYFTSRVRNDEPKGRTFFERGLDILTQQLRECTEGLLECSPEDSGDDGSE